jgi:type II secretory pathway component PulC
MHLLALLVALLADRLDVVELQIHKADPTHYTVTYEVIDVLLAEAPRLPLRVVPERRGKRTVGIKLLDIKPDSLGAKLGFRDRDIVTAVNDLPLTDPAEVLSAYARTRDAKLLTLSVTRAGKPVSIVWEVLGKRPADAVKRPPTPAGGSPASPPDPRADEILSQIARVDDTHFRIKRNAAATIAIDPGLLARSVRVVPEVKDGRPAGVRLFGIRPNTIPDAIGFQNGDVLLQVNGVALTDPAEMLKVQAQLRKADVLHLSVLRRGQPLVIEGKVE